MELLAGESLYQHFALTGPIPWRRMLDMACQICESLGEAHMLGIVHRDLKPANIQLMKAGGRDFIKVLDFGIAKIVSGESNRELTVRGELMGTLEYMSPEQLYAGRVTERSDIYALGVILYEMITGRSPFPPHITATAALAHRRSVRPDPMSRRVPVPPELERIVMRCLEPDSRHRYPTIDEVRDDLRRLRTADRAATPPISPPKADAPQPSYDLWAATAHRRHARRFLVACMLVGAAIGCAVTLSGSSRSTVTAWHSTQAGRP